MSVSTGRTTTTRTDSVRSKKSSGSVCPTFAVYRILTNVSLIYLLALAILGEVLVLRRILLWLCLLRIKMFVTVLVYKQNYAKVLVLMLLLML